MSLVAASPYWYLARGTGVVSLLLLTATLVVGVATSTRWRSRLWPAFLVTNLHRNLTLLALAFLGVHITSSVLDSYTPIRLVDAVVPFVSAYRPLWLGLGALAFDLLLALTVTGLLRNRIGFRTFRTLHWLAYAAWPLAVLHGLGAGTDARRSWLAGITSAAVSIVVLAVVWRLARNWNARPLPRVAAIALTASLVGAGVVWFDHGPLRSGWAARAGTPKALLASATSSASTRLQAPFDDTVSGTLAETGPDASGGVTLSIDARARGQATARLRLTLRGTALQTGIQITDSRVTFGPATAPDAYSGSVSSISGDRMSIPLRGPSRLRLELVLRIDSATGGVSGALHATRA